MFSVHLLDVYGLPNMAISSQQNLQWLSRSQSGRQPYVNLDDLSYIIYIYAHESISNSPSEF